MQSGERKQSLSLHTAWKISVKSVISLLVLEIFMLLPLNAHSEELSELIQKLVQLRLPSLQMKLP